MPFTDNTLTSLDVDNTTLDTTRLGDAAYKAVGLAMLGREVPMLTHPVTGEKDPKYGLHDLTGIWRYKIDELLCGGVALEYKGREIVWPSEIHLIDIEELTTKISIASKNILERDGVEQYARRILSLENLAKLREQGNLGIVTANGPGVQKHLLTELGYFADRINPALCVYGEREGGKVEAFTELLDTYWQEMGILPKTFVYVGDAPSDMEAVVNSSERIRRVNHYAVGVLSGSSNPRDLNDAGANLILDSLADPEEIATLIFELERWKHER